MGLLGSPAKANIVSAEKCRACTALDISNIRKLKAKNSSEAQEEHFTAT
jgi:hypothetical protein